MKTEQVVLVGGPNDGQRISVPVGIPHIRVLPRRPARVVAGVGSMPTAAVVENVVYRRIPVASDKGFYGAAYAFEDTDVMAALLNGYRKP